MKKILFCFPLCLILWLGGLAWFVMQIPDQALLIVPPVDAIVVLTGGSGRLEYGLKLLAQGKGKELFVSGVSKDITTEHLLEEVPAEIRASLTPDNIQHIVLGHTAENTIGNALETVSWLKKRNYQTILLVTANYHMPRSVDEFTEAAPDITIIPAPVFPDNFQLASWWNDASSRFLMLSEYHKFLAGQVRHWIVFLLRRS